jgi:hypothetical protein
MTAFTIFGLCVIFTRFLLNERSRSALFSNPMNLVILIAVVPLVMVILGLAIFFNYRNANKLENAVVSSASGAIRFDSSFPVIVELPVITYMWVRRDLRLLTIWAPFSKTEENISSITAKRDYMNL